MPHAHQYVQPLLKRGALDVAAGRRQRWIEDQAALRAAAQLAAAAAKAAARKVVEDRLYEERRAKARIRRASRGYRGTGPRR